MKIDNIIGNPPYNSDTRKNIYIDFIQKAKELDTKYISMIVPSNWLLSGNENNEFSKFSYNMLTCNHIIELHDYPLDKISSGYKHFVFTEAHVPGGVCYFLYNKDYTGMAKIVTHFNNFENKKDEEATRYLLEEGCSTFIRRHRAVDIYRKIYNKTKNELKFDSIIIDNPFKLETYEHGSIFKNGEMCRLYYSDRYEQGGKVGYIENRDFNASLLEGHKVFISSVSSSRAILQKPFYGEPCSVCTKTYIMIGPFKDKETCDNVESYLNTKFLRFLVSLVKISHHAESKFYRLVPLQDFTYKITDEILYEKYELTSEEIAFIEDNIKMQ